MILKINSERCGQSVVMGAKIVKWCIVTATFRSMDVSTIRIVVSGLRK